MPLCRRGRRRLVGADWTPPRGRFGSLILTSWWRPKGSWNRLLDYMRDLCIHLKCSIFIHQKQQAHIGGEEGGSVSSGCCSLVTTLFSYSLSVVRNLFRGSWSSTQYGTCFCLFLGRRLNNFNIVTYQQFWFRSPSNPPLNKWISLWNNVIKLIGLVAFCVQKVSFPFCPPWSPPLWNRRPSVRTHCPLPGRTGGLQLLPVHTCPFNLTLG